MNFIKLKSTIDIKDYVINNTFISYGLNDKGTFKGIKYSKIDTSYKENIFSLIPKEYQHHFSISIMELNWTIPPHTDSNITASINCYINTDNCVTQFYKLKSDVVELEKPKWSPPTQTDGKMFSINDLNEDDSFIANPGEIYLLNVAAPHSVKRPAGAELVNRTAICLQSKKFNFSETVKMLKATDNL